MTTRRLIQRRGFGRDLTVAIVGGGIGGLATALCLNRAGIDAHVFEQGTEFGEAGAGIQLGPNAVRILHSLGLAVSLRERSVRPTAALDFRRWDDGRLLGFQASADEYEQWYGAPYYVVHRAHLLRALLEQLPTSQLHSGHQCVGVDVRDDSAVVRFADHGGFEADVVVGADGLNSLLRRQTIGDIIPEFTGLGAFRGLVPRASLPESAELASVSVWVGPGQHFVHYPVSGGLLNLVGLVTLPDPEPFQRRDATPAQFRQAFADWNPQMLALIDALGHTQLWGLFRVARLPRWVTGRVTLIGDAAHAMLPFAAQGACQAIEDAAALAACLTDGRDDIDVDVALARFEAGRMPRAEQVQALADANAVTFHLEDGPDQIRRDAALAERSRHTLDWLFSYDAIKAMTNRDLSRDQAAHH